MKDKLITLRWFLLTLPMPLFPNASKTSTLSHFPAFQGALLGFNQDTLNYTGRSEKDVGGGPNFRDFRDFRDFARTVI